jgi:uncharacterized protein
MLNHKGVLLLSAADLADQLACQHLTRLDRAVAEGRREVPTRRDPALGPLQERGFAHKKAYIEHLRARGLGVVELRDLDGAMAADRACAAMRDGLVTIVQVELRDVRWRGRAHVLLRVPEPSDLGDWSYEVMDLHARNLRSEAGYRRRLADIATEVRGVTCGRDTAWSPLSVTKPGPQGSMLG